MKKYDNKGFSTVEALLILAIAAILVGTGWYVWRQRNNSSAPTNASSQNSTVNNTTRTATVANWVTYTNRKHGYSFLYPKTIQNGYGGCKKETNSYRPVTVYTPTSVVENGDTVYLTNSYYYKLTGQTDDGGLSNFSGCVKTNSTVADLVNQNTRFYFNNIPITVKDVKTQGDLASTVNTALGTCYKYSSIKKSVKGNWFDVDVDFTCQTGASYKILRYYQTTNKFVFIEMGQYNHFIPQDSKDMTDYNQKFIGSFKF